jgi:hypothetical protein
VCNCSLFGPESQTELYDAVGGLLLGCEGEVSEISRILTVSGWMGGWRGVEGCSLCLDEQRAALCVGVCLRLT